jgi:hypothetical protein
MHRIAAGVAIERFQECQHEAALGFLRVQCREIDDARLAHARDCLADELAGAFVERKISMLAAEDRQIEAARLAVRLSRKPHQTPSGS